MSTPVILNGEKVTDGERVLSSWNRSFHFGDGLFETLRVFDGKAPFLKQHFHRASQGMKRLGMTPPPEWEQERVAEDIARLSKDLGRPNARFRITVFRGGSGAYTPGDEQAEMLMEYTGELPSRFHFPSERVRVGVYRDAFRYPGPFSALKTTSALFFVMAKRWARQEGLDEALLLDPEGRVLEGASSNLFLIKDNGLFTPPVEQGCVDGVMRKLLIELAVEIGMELFTESLGVDDLLRADEVLLCNAVQGILPVHHFQDRDFTPSRAEKLLNALNERAFS